MKNTSDRRESRFFTGDEKELNELKKKQSFQRFVKKKQTKRRFSRIFSAAFLIAVVAIFIIVCLNLFFKVSHIETVGTARYVADDILAYTDVEKGMSLFAVSDRDFEGVSQHLAYVEDIKVTRKFPDTVVINVIEAEPVYVSELYGEYFILSDEYRVLDRVFRKEDFAELALIELVLPEIDSAIVGADVEFSALVSKKYVTAYVDALEASPLYSKATAFDLRDRFNLAMIAKGIYLINLGNGDELGTKLTAVAGMLDHSVLSDGVPATIDATDPTQCPVIKNPDLKIEFDD